MVSLYNVGLVTISPLFFKSAKQLQEHLHQRWSCCCFIQPKRNKESGTMEPFIAPLPSFLTGVISIFISEWREPHNKWWRFENNQQPWIPKFQMGHRIHINLANPVIYFWYRNTGHENPSATHLLITYQ